MHRTLELMSRRSGPLGIVTLTGCLIALLLATGCETGAPGELPYALSAPGAVLDLGAIAPQLRSGEGVNRRATVGNLLQSAAVLRVRVRESGDPLAVIEEFPFTAEVIADGEDIVLSGLPPGLGVLVTLEILDAAGEILLGESGVVDLIPGEVAVFVPQGDGNSAGSGGGGSGATLFLEDFDSGGGLTQFDACQLAPGPAPIVATGSGVGGSGGVDIGGLGGGTGALQTILTFDVANSDGFATCFEATVRITESTGKIFTGLVTGPTCLSGTQGPNIEVDNVVGIRLVEGSGAVLVNPLEGSTPLASTSYVGSSFHTVGICVKSDGEVAFFLDGNPISLSTLPSSIPSGTSLGFTVRAQNGAGSPEGKVVDDVTVFTILDGSL